MQTSVNYTLDLDNSKSINDLGILITTRNIANTIYVLIELVKKFGTKIGIIYRNFIDITQYVLTIKYLNNMLSITFEFDSSYQYITLLCYNKDQTKTYLKILISINDEPTIKYVENDRSGFIPTFSNKYISLKSGEYLINFSHCLLSYIGFDRIRLDDDSHLITVNQDGLEIKTKLWLYYLIKYGKSWYSKFGYQPTNSTNYELQMILDDVRNIKLSEISICLKKFLSITNLNIFNDVMINISQKMVNLIDISNQTLYEYTMSHHLEEFANLTNNMTQSCFSKNIEIIVDNQLFVLEFPWFEKCRKLLIANVMQINNDIKQYYCQLE